MWSIGMPPELRGAGRDGRTRFACATGRTARYRRNEPGRAKLLVGECAYTISARFLMNAARVCRTRDVCCRGPLNLEEIP